MRIIRKARDEGYKPTTQSISVGRVQHLTSWEQEVTRPVIMVQVADRVLEMKLSEANELKRKLEEVIMDIEEARTWL